MIKKTTRVALIALAAALLWHSHTDAAEKKIKKEKLQIVFLMGQSNMVGLAEPRTAWYLTRPQYVPPRDVAVKKGRCMDGNMYWWIGYKGPAEKEKRLEELWQEWKHWRAIWRQRHRGVHGPWQTEEWGPKPRGGRASMYPFLDKKAEEAGQYERIAEILDSRDNQFTVYDAYEEIATRDREIAGELARVREIYLKGTTAEDFDALEAAIEKAVEEKKLVLKVLGGRGAVPEPEKNRAIFAELARKHVNLPIAKRTRIYGHGHIAGSAGEGNQVTTHGPLSIGYGGGIHTIGPEYGVGITLERLVDAPILLVKCAWGNTTLAGSWRPPSLDGVETPTEKAVREEWNRTEAAKAKQEGREFTPRPAPKKTGQLGYAIGMALPQVDKVLADPGRYHPEYDPKVGYEVAGLVWFQGFSDAHNTAYGEQLAQFIRDFRKQVKTPDMPVVCGALGMSAFKHKALTGHVNAGMVQAAQMPDLAGTVDVVNTAPFYPVEFQLLKQVVQNAKKGSPEYQEAMTVQQRAVSNRGFHYFGNAKCFLLMGDAMARSLANLMADGEPTVSAVAGSRAAKE